jgi:hypothetical protein
MAGKIWVDADGNKYRRHFSSQVSINKATGTKIALRATEDSDAYEGGLVWETACLDHATTCSHGTLTDARGWASWPEWCGPCQHIIYHDTDECLSDYYSACAFDPQDLSVTRTDVNDDVEIGTRYRFEPINECGGA